MSDTNGMVWWTELMTADPATARDYYERCCGWTFKTMEMSQGDYLVGHKGDTPLVGIVDTNEHSDMGQGGPRWFSYFAVDDLDAAVAATREAGGQVMREPFEVPGIGRIAILQDPTGAQMGMMTPEAPPG